MYINYRKIVLRKCAGAFAGRVKGDSVANSVAVWEKVCKK